MMKDSFNRFALRLVTAMLLGLLLLAARGREWSALAVFMPNCTSPWEMSKLAYWPLLGAMLLTGRWGGGIRAALRRAAPCLALLPVVLTLLFWILAGLEPGVGVYLAVWTAALAIGLALTERRASKGGIWLVLAVAMGAAYVLFTLLPPGAGPFLDPHSAAAMAVIPF